MHYSFTAFLVACMRLHRLVGQSVGRFATWYVCSLNFWHFWNFFWSNRSCPNAPVISYMAPAYPHANEVAVYPASFTIY